MILDYIINQTDTFLNSKSKSERKKIGQFFTSKETAMYMSTLFEIPAYETISILDPGSGSGILSAALIEFLGNNYPNKKINLTCYENNKDVLELLKLNLEYIKANINLDFNYIIIQDNYILSQRAEFNNELIKDINPIKYDLIIGNPPYLKIAKTALEALSMPELCHGAPNLYFLFAAMSIFNLKAGGDLVYIIPRSWTSGAYFKRFREYLLRESQILNIHLFKSRNKVFEKEDVLQETIIIRIKKIKQINSTISITTSESNKDFHNLTYLNVPYDIVVSGKNSYIYLVTNKEEVNVLKTLKQFDSSLPDLNIKMKTGLTVDFRTQEELRKEEGIGNIPLFYSQHIREGNVIFPIGKEYEYITTNLNGLVQENKNYLFVKRFTSKEEHRRLQCGIYLSKNLPNYNHISTQNKINFIDSMIGESLSIYTIYGLYVLFNSTIYDTYYRILNGSTQVNSTEINTFPVPDLSFIDGLGLLLYKSGDLTTDNCDIILKSIL